MEGRIEVKLDDNHKVTHILTHGISSRDIPTLCHDLTRCCGQTVICTKTKGGKSTLVPEQTVIIDDFVDAHSFLTETIGDLVDDISFCQDKEAILTQELLNVLIEDFTKKIEHLKLLEENKKKALILTGDLAEKRRQAHYLQCSISVVRKLHNELQNLGQLIHYISEHGFSGHCEAPDCNNFLSIKRVTTVYSLVCCTCIKKMN